VKALSAKSRQQVGSSAKLKARWRGKDAKAWRKKVIRAYESGMTIRQICGIFNMGHETVRKILANKF